MKSFARAPSVFFVLTSLAACGSPAPTATDDGGIRIPDAGPIQPDVGNDAASDPEPDAGDGPCGAVLNVRGWDPIPDSCLPRCSAETFAAWRTCTDDGCRRAALLEDETPPVAVGVPVGDIVVGCAFVGVAYGCTDWQNYACSYEACPDEYETFIGCYNAGGACTAEGNALNACTRGSEVFAACVTERVEACFVH